MATHTHVRQQLEERLRTLVNRVGRIDGDLRKEHDKDWEEQSIELQNDEVLEGLDTASRAEVDQILATLKRIGEGKYGFCTECGQPIAEDRLQAMPTALTCIWCAAS